MLLALPSWQPDSCLTPRCETAIEAPAGPPTSTSSVVSRWCCSGSVRCWWCCRPFEGLGCRLLNMRPTARHGAGTRRRDAQLGSRAPGPSGRGRFGAGVGRSRISEQTDGDHVDVPGEDAMQLLAKAILWLHVTLYRLTN